jgi:uncharacterized protein YggU (UPF0235/DUF167 family)
LSWQTGLATKEFEDNVKNDLWGCVVEGMLAVRVTPKAAQNRIVVVDGVVRIYVTTAPEGGKANKAVQKLLAKAMGVAKSDLLLLRGSKDRDKVFQVKV